MEDIRPLGLVQIVKESFRLYKRHAMPLLALSCMVGLPVHLAHVLFFMPADTSNPLARIYAGLAAIIFTLIVAVVARTPLIYFVMKVREGQRPKLSEALRSLWMHGGTILLAAIVVCFFVLVGLVLLIVPGILLLLWFSLYQPVIVKENITVVEALKRSRELTAGVMGKALIFFLLPIFIEGAVRWLIAPLIPLWNGSTMSLIAIDTVLFTLVLPLEALLFTLLYYDARVRSEAYQSLLLHTKTAIR